MREIKLTRGKVALVDDEHYEWLNQWKWYAQPKRDTYYAFKVERVGSCRKTVRMHRLIMGITDPKVQVDHRDHNGLNNQCFNLRKATNQQNTQNRRKPSNNTSGYKGVYWHSQCRKWRAMIPFEGRLRCLGLYIDKETAIAVRNRAELLYFNDFACIEHKDNL